MFRKGQKTFNKKYVSKDRFEEDHKGRYRKWVYNLLSSTEKDGGNQHMDSLYNIIPQY